MIPIREFLQARDEFINERDAAQFMHRRVDSMADVAVLSAVLDKLIEGRCRDVGIARFLGEVIWVLAGLDGLRAKVNRA